MHKVKQFENRLIVLALTGFSMTAQATAASIYVSNENTGKVSYYDQTTGAAQGVISGFTAPADMAFNSSGSLFIADIGANAVFRYNPGTNLLSVFALVTSAYGVAVDGSGNVYVTSRNGGQVIKFDPNGNQIGSPLSVSRARGIMFDAFDSKLYVVSTPNSDGSGGTDAIEQISTTLSLLNGSFITGNINAPRDVIADASGNIFVSNTGAGSNTGFISQFTSAGVFSAAGVTSLGGPNQLALAAGGNPSYFAEYFNNDVVKCSPSCASFITQGSAGGGTGVHGLALGLTPTLTPEPATLSFIGMGLAGLAFLRRKR